jgi:hypothetical protein
MEDSMGSWPGQQQYQLLFYRSLLLLIRLTEERIG